MYHSLLVPNLTSKSRGIFIWKWKIYCDFCLVRLLSFSSLDVPSIPALATMAAPNIHPLMLQFGLSFVAMRTCIRDLQHFNTVEHIICKVYSFHWLVLVLKIFRQTFFFFWVGLQRLLYSNTFYFLGDRCIFFVITKSWNWAEIVTQVLIITQNIAELIVTNIPSITHTFLEVLKWSRTRVLLWVAPDFFPRTGSENINNKLTKSI